MRRSVITLAAVVASFAGAFAVLGLPQQNTTGQPTTRSVIDGALWALGDQGTTSSNPATTYTTCPPANSAACQQIIVGVEGVLVTAAANQVVGFVTGTVTSR